MELDGYESTSKMNSLTFTIRDILRPATSHSQDPRPIRIRSYHEIKNTIEHRHPGWGPSIIDQLIWRQVARQDIPAGTKEPNCRRKGALPIDDTLSQLEQRVWRIGRCQINQNRRNRGEPPLEEFECDTMEMTSGTKTVTQDPTVAPPSRHPKPAIPPSPGVTTSKSRLREFAATSKSAYAPCKLHPKPPVAHTETKKKDASKKPPFKV
jgi:hypothetical protein